MKKIFKLSLIITVFIFCFVGLSCLAFAIESFDDFAQISDQTSSFDVFGEDSPTDKSTKAYHRFNGVNRYDTMRLVVSETIEYNSAVKNSSCILCRGDDFPDALSATPYAGLLNCSIVLTDAKNPVLRDEAITAIENLNANKVYVPGTSLPQNLRNQVLAIDCVDEIIPIENHSFDSRIGTSLAIYEAGKSIGSSWADTAIVAYGYDFPDALSIAPLAYKMHFPVFLANYNHDVGEQVLDALGSAHFSKVLILGSTAAISQKGFDDIENVVGSGKVDRVYGSGRYDTAKAIADLETQEYGMTHEHITVSWGEDFPDALSAGPLCGSTNSILLLTNTDSRYENSVDLTYDCAVEMGLCYVTGSYKSISNNVFDKLDYAHKCIPFSLKAEESGDTTIQLIVGNQYFKYKHWDSTRGEYVYDDAHTHNFKLQYRFAPDATHQDWQTIEVKPDDVDPDEEPTGDSFTGKIINLTLHGQGSVIYLRGDNPEGIGGEFTITSAHFYNKDKKFSCDGNLFYLTDYKAIYNKQTPTLKEDHWGCLFQGAYWGFNKLINAPVLPETNLAPYCYQGMFACNDELVEPPELPATVLKKGCYWSMFNQCSKIVECPDLPATQIAERCYYDMFSYCESLETSPAILPAETLYYACYEDMFAGSYNLLACPQLPATKLAESCYSCMFYGCEAIVTPPSLTASKMKPNCYASMFEGCISLETTPTLNSTQLSSYCYQSMFSGCSSLEETVAGLPATKLEESCYESMFAGCTNLETMCDLDSTQLSVNCYDNMFAGCSALLNPSALPATNLTENCYKNMFSGCEQLQYVPTLSSTSLANSGYESMFQGCTTITTPTALAADELTDSCYKNMYHGCSALTDFPALPATQLANNCYEGMFYECSAINKQYPKLEATTLASECYKDMFGYCSSAIDPWDLEATVLKEACYSGMFSHNSFVSAPKIFATTYAKECCKDMFAGCTLLKDVYLADATVLEESCFERMFASCTSLEFAPNLCARELVKNCYKCMFDGCSNLKFVQANFLDWNSTEDSTKDWLKSCYANGVFVVNDALDISSTDTN
ncbi:MAG: cell wall-binding repeat-containing protein, partial [Coriobacteriales bacterium]|nr:cell wall-binding repeat-containing protein [Coriobacteriales bacterium]